MAFSHNQDGKILVALVSANPINEAGFHQVHWNGLNDLNEAIGSGEYLCQMGIGDFVAVKKMVLIR